MDEVNNVNADQYDKALQIKGDETLQQLGGRSVFEDPNFDERKALSGLGSERENTLCLLRAKDVHSQFGQVS